LRLWQEILKLKEDENKFRELLYTFKKIPKPPEEKMIEEVIEEESFIPEEFFLPQHEQAFKNFISKNRIIKIKKYINEELVGIYEQVNIEHNDLDDLLKDRCVLYVYFYTEKRREKLVNLDEFKIWCSSLTQEQKELIHTLWLSTLSPKDQLDRWRVENDFKNETEELTLAKKYNEVCKHYSDKLYPGKWWDEGRYSIFDDERDYSPYPWGD